MPTRTHIDDGVWRKITAEIKRHRRSHVRVGVLADEGGDQSHESGVTMVQLAIIHELGAPEVNIPARAPLRTTFEKKERIIRKMIAKLAEQVLERKIDMDRALELLGAFAAAEVKKTITVGSPLEPPLLYRTGRPLFDTGGLAGAYAHKVEKK